jgi:hypothetical protein
VTAHRLRRAHQIFAFSRFHKPKSTRPSVCGAKPGSAGCAGLMRAADAGCREAAVVVTSP